MVTDVVVLPLPPPPPPPAAAAAAAAVLDVAAEVYPLFLSMSLSPRAVGVTNFTFLCREELYELSSCKKH